MERKVGTWEVVRHRDGTTSVFLRYPNGWTRRVSGKALPKAVRDFLQIDASDARVAG